MINNKTFTAEVATSSADQQIGLSDRKSLGKDDGMLFVFDKPDYHIFWMHAMKFPLDMVFVLGNKVMAIFQDLPPAKDQAPTYGSDVLSDKVLELNAGIVKKYNIKVGDTVKTNL